MCIQLRVNELSWKYIFYEELAISHTHRHGVGEGGEQKGSSISNYCKDRAIYQEIKICLFFSVYLILSSC